MATSNDPAPGADLPDPPEFELEALYDDPVRPSELTVFDPGAGDRTTRWITADRSTAVPLDRIR